MKLWNRYEVKVLYPLINYASPVYGVATICHQVCWLRWGHPSLFHTATSHYTPAPPKVERGYTGFTLMSVRPSVRLSVRLSVRPSVGKVSATFRENYWLNSFHPWDLYLWGKSLDPYRFSCSCPHFWPSGGQKLTENRGFRNFRENCRLDSFHPRDLYLWG